ncbi:DUF2252 domain-containing protein [Agromyces protaetiae]|uniref:DUF2252 domain-containing protein n=1 Tax=Agromyces protaetiae TaxID=2509455 RepID=A0A4P6FQD4_9MICO|nr:DUF2252 domain-containing protein [Agromyces protaetiae]QAY72738.1 DUF2252 domain-containing protein [Agromyces protaetiae]
MSDPTLFGTGAGHPGGVPRKERKAMGRSAREAVPLEAQGRLDPADRDPVAVLEAQAETRVKELISLRYARMSASPFTFYRGAAMLMAIDLRAHPDSGVTTQLCGDAHLSNVGVYASPERRLVLDLNDFDETATGPFEWDVKRMATSFEIAGRNNGFDDDDRARIVREFLIGYSDAIAEAAGLPVMAVHSSHIELEQVLEQGASQLSEDDLARARKGMAKTRARDSRQAARSLTERIEGMRRFRSDPPILVPRRELVAHLGLTDAEVDARFEGVLESYEASLPLNRRRIISKYHVEDAAIKVVGVGSVGTRAWVVLLRGNGKNDVLVLQAKEAQRSVLEPPDGPSAYEHQGQRVVEGQQVMQALSDVLLGWASATGLDGQPRDFYVRQFRDMKGSFAPEKMDPVALGVYARFCASVLARAHARAGDAAVIHGYVGGGARFADALGAFATAYADRNGRDHAALLEAIRTGRVEAAATV